MAFDGAVDEAAAGCGPSSGCVPGRKTGRGAPHPAEARHENGEWCSSSPKAVPEPLLRSLIDGGAGIETLAIERPGLHDAFVSIAATRRLDAMQLEKVQ